MLYNQLLEPISTYVTVGTPHLSTPPYTPHNSQPSFSHRLCPLASMVQIAADLINYHLSSTIKQSEITHGKIEFTYSNSVGNLLLLGHGPFGLEVTLIFKGTEASLKITQPI